MPARSGHTISFCPEALHQPINGCDAVSTIASSRGGLLYAEAKSVGGRPQSARCIRPPTSGECELKIEVVVCNCFGSFMSAQRVLLSPAIGPQPTPNVCP